MPVRSQSSTPPSPGRTPYTPTGLLGTEGTVPVPFPHFPKEPVSLHCNTLVMSAIPLRLYDSGEITAVKLHISLVPVIFIHRGTCLSKTSIYEGHPKMLDSHKGVGEFLHNGALSLLCLHAKLVLILLKPHFVAFMVPVPHLNILVPLKI